MFNGWRVGASVIIAAVASAVCVAVLNRYRPRSMALSGDWLCLCSVVAGAILGHAVLGLWPRWPPANALDRLLAIGLPAAIVLLLIGKWLGNSPRLKRALDVLFALGFVRILLHRSVYLQDEPAGTIVFLAISAGLLLMIQTQVTRIWDRTQQASILLTSAVTLGSAGLLVLMAGYIKGGSAAFPWAAAIAGVTIAACSTKRRADLKGVLGLTNLILFGILFIGRFFGGLTTDCALLVLLIPALVWVQELPVIRNWGTWQKECVYLSLVAVTLLAVLLSAKRVFDREMAPLVNKVRTPGQVVAVMNLRPGTVVLPGGKLDSNPTRT